MINRKVVSSTSAVVPVRSASRQLIPLLLLALAPSCALHHAGPDGERTNRGVITQQQMVENHFLTAYDAVESLRSNWLQTRGTDSFSAPSEVRVYLDNTFLGGITTLRDITASTVSYIRYYDGISATGRWGLGHGAGVIFVSQHPLSSANPDAHTDPSR
jgi:hypothetical protein